MRYLALLALLVGAAEASAEEVRRFALVVGANDGGVDRAMLRYAHRDAEAIGQVMQELGGVEPEDHELLLDPDPGRLLDALAQLSDEVAAVEGRTEVVFYYSGHSDEQGILLGAERVEYPDLRAELGAVSSDVRVAILDSCASGSLIRSKGGRHRAPFLIDEATRVDGVAYITSSSEDEAAQEAERVGGSFFTHYLASGLRGAADVSGDGRVTLNEAYRFAFEETLSTTEKTRYGPQHAAYDFQLSGTGELVLTDLKLTSSTLVLGTDVVGRAAVRDGSDRLVAELSATGEQPIELGLSPGTYIVRLTEAQGWAEQEVSLVEGQRLTVDASKLAWAEGELTAARGDVEEPGPAQQVLEDLGLDHLQDTTVSWQILPAPEFKDADLAVGLLGTRVSGTSWGASSTALNVTRDSSGAFTTFGANIATGDTTGAQLSLAYNHAENIDGTQLTLFANTATGTMQGVQIAPVGVNLATGDGWIGQISFVNMAPGSFDGFQISGLNIADGLRGSQIGFANYGRRVHGTQIGLVNIAGVAKGVQLGLINIAKSSDTPIGLISISGDGRFSISAFATELDLVNVDVRFGGRTGLYTLVGGGRQGNDQFYMAVGMGAHTRPRKTFADFDLSLLSFHPSYGDPFVSPSFVARSRVQVGYHLFERLAPFAGVSYNVRLPTEQEDQSLLPEYAERDGYVIRTWPGVYGGIQF